MNRSTALASILASALLVLACGGPPEVPSPQNGPAAGGQSQGGSAGLETGGGLQLGPYGGDGGASDGGEAGSLGGDEPPSCGDGKVNAGETGDDGNAMPGDGCDGNCKLEAVYKCPKPGKPCENIPTTPAECGNGKIEGAETCDLGKDSAGKSLNDDTQGCSKSCSTVKGW